MTDDALELAIERARLRLALAKGRRARERAWNQLQSLVGKRLVNPSQQPDQHRE